MQHSGMPPPTRQPGHAAAVTKQQRQQHGLVQLTHHITRLENEVHLAMAVMDKDTCKLLNYGQLMNSPKYKRAWSLSEANEFGQLANGIGGRQFACSVRPEKAEPNQMQFTVGGNRINYPSKVATPTAEMLVATMLFNSVISTKETRFMTMDISNFYLMTPLHRAEFIRIKISDIPDYKLREKATKNGSIYIRAKRGMYGLPQAGLLANKLLKKRLNKHRYRQSKLVPGLWKHNTRPIQFTLVVGDFSIKYVGKEHAQHLKNALKEHYKLTCD
jgi:hypothetical protein